VTISDEYAVLNARLHRDVPAYGASGDLYAGAVLAIANRLGTRSVLHDGACKSGRYHQKLISQIWTKAIMWYMWIMELGAFKVLCGENCKIVNANI
jgi:hypothetical protein